MSAKKRSAPKKPVPVSEPLVRPLDRPLLSVRVVWPKTGHHADATQAIGRALAAVVSEASYKEEAGENGLGYVAHSYQRTVIRFDVRVQHEGEKP